MADNVQDACRCVGRVAAYTLYNLGLAFPVGLVHTVISVAFLAKHWFYNEEYQAAASKEFSQQTKEFGENAVQRNRNVRQADQKARNAKGVWNKIKATGNQIGSRACQLAGDALDSAEEWGTIIRDDAKTSAVEEFENTLFNSWKEEAIRGILTMCLIGAPYYTYVDNFKNRNVSIFGLQELIDKISQEKKLDASVYKLINPSSC